LTTYNKRREEQDALLSGYYAEQPSPNAVSLPNGSKCKCRCTGRGLFGFLSVLATAVGVISLAFVLIIRNDPYPFTHIGDHHLDETVYTVGESTAAVGTAFAFLSLLYACCKWSRGFFFILLVHFFTSLGYCCLILGMMFDIQKALAIADKASHWSISHIPNMWVFVFCLAATGAIFHVWLLVVGCIYAVKTRLMRIIDELEKQSQPVMPATPVYPESLPQYYVLPQAQQQQPQYYIYQ